jgi:CubicO group peptidase (beta-lactamase class C family)
MAIVPFDHIISSYSADQFERAVGTGYYSSLNDMTRIGLSILNSTFLTSAQARRWLKLNAFRSNVNDSVGASWEVFRAPGERVSYLYTKAGLLGSYSSQLALMPDYIVGFTVLAAGKAGLPQVQVLSNMLAEIFYPALEAAAKEEADANYAGTSQDPTGINSSVTVVTDGRPGLGVPQWIFNGTDFLSTSSETTFSLVKLSHSASGSIPLGSRPRLRRKN